SRTGPHVAGRIAYGADDVLIAGAPAEVAFEAFADGFLVRIRVVGQQIDRLHDHAGSAETALECVVVAEGLLHRVELPVAGEPLHGGDLTAVRLDGQDRTGLHAPPVERDGAGAAVTRVAADHGSGLAELPPQMRHEQSPGFDVIRVVGPVDGGGGAHGASCGGSVRRVDGPRGTAWADHRGR